MRGEVNITVVLILVVGLITAAIATGFSSGVAGDVQEKSNKTISDTGKNVSNISCKAKCTENNPARGPSYYSCVQGC